MSQILKAKNRILNRRKNINQDKNSESNQGTEYDDQIFDIQHISYPKKFNISSISMKFHKNIEANNHENHENQLYRSP